MSENKLIGVVVTTAIAILIAATGGIIYAKKTRDEARRQEIVALGNDLSATISQANTLTTDLEFQDAADALQAMQPRIITAGNSELSDQLNRAIYNVTEAEADYKDKIKQGYTVFEGRMVSPKQKEEMLAKKRRQAKEERRLKEEQRRLVAERERAAEEAHEKEEEKRRLAKAKRELGFWGSAHRLESGVVKRIGDVDVVLGYRFSTVYTAENAADLMSNRPHFGVFFPIGYRKPGEQFTNPAAGFIPVNGNPQKIEITSSDESVVKVYDDGSASFQSAGKVRITVRVAGESVLVPIAVVQLPLNAARFPNNATSAEEVIRLLGMPDEKNQHYFSWPDSKEVDGIFYSPSVDGGISTEHWKYKKYPGMAIAIVGRASGGWVWCIGTYREKG